MITRGCRIQRMMADPDYNQLTKVQDKPNASTVSERKPIRLLPSRYTLLYNMISRDDKSVVNRETFPLPRGRWILSGNAQAVRFLSHNGITFGSMAPRSCVVAK
jgi:hypothetical protein